MISATQNKSFLAYDSALPNRDELLNADLMVKRFKNLFGKNFDSCEIVRVKYRPGTSLRILYRLETEGDSVLITARSLTNFWGKYVFENSPNQTVIYYDEEFKTVFWEFPSDKKIKQLDIINNVPQALKEIGGKIWQQSELVGYAPEKCAIVKCLTKNGEIISYAKIFAGRESNHAYSIYDNYYYQRPANERFLFPKVLYYSDYYQTLFIEPIEGKRLADLDKKDSPNSFQLFGKAIAKLHNVKPFMFLTEFSRLNPKRLSITLEIIEKTLPENDKQAKNLAQRLKGEYEFPDEPIVSLHGDVHTKNAILRKDGRLTLIDLDQMSFGKASADIGSFLAGLFYKECTGEISREERQDFTKNFFIGYEQVRQLPSEKSLNWHTATAVFTERCGRAINRFRMEGLEHFSEILTLSEAILEGGNL